MASIHMFGKSNKIKRRDITIACKGFWNVNRWKFKSDVKYIIESMNVSYTVHTICSLISNLLQKKCFERQHTPIVLAKDILKV